MKIVVATKNPGKVREFAALLADLGLELVAATEMPEVDETGATFADNAALKARAAAEWAGLWALGEDSGLEVDALGGAPGIHSNRFAGPNTTEEMRNRRLLELLADVSEADRTARYRAALAVASPTGELHLFHGACEGRILAEPRGKGGFGYDPLFYLPEYGCTMAELPPEEKNRISHRARAVAAAIGLLGGLTTETRSHGEGAEVLTAETQRAAHHGDTESRRGGGGIDRRDAEGAERD
jgi:XTP/dITP diphosphohydrolase